MRSSLLQPIFEASLASLELQSVDPLNAVLQFLRDVLAYGRPSPPTSAYPDNPTAVQDAVKAMALNKGEAITQKILSGLMYSFPRDCVPDSSGVLLALVELCPDPWLQWMKHTLEILPAGSVSPAEAQKFLKTLERYGIYSCLELCIFNIFITHSLTSFIAPSPPEIGRRSGTLYKISRPGTDVRTLVARCKTPPARTFTCN